MKDEVQKAGAPSPRLQSCTRMRINQALGLCPSQGSAYEEFKAPAAPAPARPPAASEEQGRELASFYGSLVQTTGVPWSRGGAEQAGPAETQQQEQPPEGVTVRPALGSAAQQQQQRQAEEAPQPPAEEPPSSSSYAAPAGPRELPAYGIARSNVGFQLLQKAGWVEGTGLGAAEQGRPEPVLPSQKQGRLGLGRAPKKPPLVPKQPAGEAQQQQQQQAAAAQASQRRPKRPLPADPLASEDLDTKVKRVRQVRGARQRHRREAAAGGSRGSSDRGPILSRGAGAFTPSPAASLPPFLTHPPLAPCLYRSARR